MTQAFLISLIIFLLLLVVILVRTLFLSIRQIQRIRNLWINSSDCTSIILQDLSDAIKADIDAFDKDLRDWGDVRDSIPTSLEMAKKEWFLQKENFQKKLIQSNLDPLNKDDIIKGYYKL